MEEGNTIIEWIKGHSTVIFIVVVGVLIGVMFLKKQSTTTAIPTSTVDTSGLQTDSSGNPIIYRDVADTFLTVNHPSNAVTPNDTQPVASAPSQPSTDPSAPIEHPIEPTSSSNSSSSTNIVGSGGTNGLLGANAKVDFTSFTYNGGLPIPAPKGSKLVQGTQARVWVIYPSATTQDLLTSGTGPASKYLTYPIGAPFVPA